MEWLLLISMILIAVYMSAQTYFSMKAVSGEPNFFSKNKNKLYSVSIGLEIYLVVLNLLAMSGVTWLRKTGGFLIVITILCVVEIIITALVDSYRKTSFRPVVMYALKAVLVVLCLEIFVFNIQSFSLVGKNVDSYTLPISQQSLSNFSTEPRENGFYASYIENTAPTVNVLNINKNTYTLYFDIEPGASLAYINVDVEFSDASNASVRNVGAKHTIVRGLEESRYMRLEASGKLKDIRIFFDLQNGKDFVLKSITLNKPIPFSFCTHRVAVMLLAAMLGYCLLRAKRFKESVSDKKHLFKVCGYMTVVAFILVTIFCSAIRDGFTPEKLGATFSQKSGNQLTQELVEAFKKGSVSLLDKPSKELINLDNPYDLSQRNEAQVNYKWDHAYYEGNYYTYYGMGATLLLFLPYNLLTGFYFPSSWAVTLFCAIGLWFIAKTYMSLIRQRFKNLPLNIAWAGLIVLLTTCGIFYSCMRPLFYEIAISSGFACVAAGAFLLLTSNILTDEKLKYWRLCASGCCFAYAVLCRPTLAVYCVAAVAVLVFGFLKQKTSDKPYKKTNDKPNKKTSDKPNKKTNDKPNKKTSDKPQNLKYALCALTPYAVIGGVQMLYNYLRFGSPLNFGVAYVLCLNDTSNADFHIIFVLIAIFAALFAMPYFVPTFPYVNSSFQTLNAKGYYFVDDGAVPALAVGLFAKALPMAGYLFTRRAYSLMPAKTRRRDMSLLLLFCVAAPLVIICSTWASGFAMRYTADFSWQLLLGALVMLFIVYPSIESVRLKRYFEIFMAVSVAAALLICLAQQFYFYCNCSLSEIEIQTFLYKIRHLYSVFK